jgi:hypothetical protein
VALALPSKSVARRVYYRRVIGAKVVSTRRMWRTIIMSYTCDVDPVPARASFLGKLPLSSIDTQYSLRLAETTLPVKLR